LPSNSYLIQEKDDEKEDESEEIVKRNHLDTRSGDFGLGFDGMGAASAYLESEGRDGIGSSCSGWPGRYLSSQGFRVGICS